MFVAVKTNPLINARFNIVFANGIFADVGFSRFSGLEASVDVIEYREGGNSPTPRKFPGLTRFPALTFEHGATNDMSVYTWCSQAFYIDPNNLPLPDTYDGTGFRQNFVVNALAADGSTVVRSWTVENAWPSMVRMGDFDALGNGALIETMTVQCEGIYAAAGPSGSGAGSGGTPVTSSGIGVPTLLAGVGGPAGQTSG